MCNNNWHDRPQPIRWSNAINVSGISQENCWEIIEILNKQGLNKIRAKQFLKKFRNFRNVVENFLKSFGKFR